ncbi:transposase [Acetobacter tropicalis]|uniref:transposase n=1 Tax=Acetobacter tropicalis TaxID=104102 RepID=UPI000A7CA097
MNTDWRSDLEVWLAPFLAALGHKAQRAMCPAYIAGLIGPGDRKSVQPMAARNGDIPFKTQIESHPGNLQSARHNPEIRSQAHQPTVLRSLQVPYPTSPAFLHRTNGNQPKNSSSLLAP